ISSRPLVEIVPLERAAMADRVVCQWDKDSCDDARFIKIDFLALGMLSLVEECVELVAGREGTPPDLSRIDFADAAVYDRICRGDTVGLFQIESRAQIQMLRRTRPRNLEDLAVEVAIVRPGPIVGGAVNPYVRRREDQRRAREAGRAYEPPLDHPLLREALAETLGVILYQDQVLQVCQALAGFTAGQAEALRRAMSRRRSRELLAEFWEEFRDGAAARGVPQATAERGFTQAIPLSLRERGDDMPCEWGSGLFGTGARRRRPNSYSSASGVVRSRVSPTWCAGRRPSSSAPRSSTSCGWVAATASGSPGASCCGKW